MTDHSAFFYGTLMAPSVLHRVIHGTPKPEPWQTALLNIEPAMLPFFCRHKVRYCDYPAIVPDKEASVRGTYVQGLTEGDLWRLDIFEGDEYERRKVKIKWIDRKGEGEEEVEVEVETYVWIAGEHRLEKGEWDFEEFTREKIGRWVGGEEYDEASVEVDEAIRAAGDDPTGGRGMDRRIDEKRQGEHQEGVLDSAV
ncbi:hypothetical protein MMC09_001169 [Bachmanniomyces sp. S44760]|nr:hypothetical protein [Bachmanniomyces sp. S44760]